MAPWMTHAMRRLRHALRPSVRDTDGRILHLLDRYDAELADAKRRVAIVMREFERIQRRDQEQQI